MGRLESSEPHGQCYAPVRSLFAAMMLLVATLIVASALGWPGAGTRQGARAERYVIPLAPRTLYWPARGWLERPVNFGFRCTLVDAAAVLDYYGASTSQMKLAIELSRATHYLPDAGPPWWIYVAPPGERPLLDTAIERIGGAAGIAVTAHTQLGVNFVRAADAIAHDEPVILNVARTPDGTLNHSLLAIGFDTRAGHAELLVLDPNTQVLQWVGPESLWSSTVTSTFIAARMARG